jgi:ubiquinone/menaquinone biosynthesis C-methylase UbiE
MGTRLPHRLLYTMAVILAVLTMLFLILSMALKISYLLVFSSSSQTKDIYLKHIIPIIGWVLLGNPENYRMLGVYTEQFGDCRSMRNALARNGLRATYHEYFFGCASGVSGIKP